MLADFRPICQFLGLLNELTYHSKLVDFGRRYQGHPSSLEVQVRLGWLEGGRREGPPSSTPNTSIHPQIDSCPKSKMVSLQNATRLLFITFFLEKKLKTPFYRKNTLEKGPNPLNHPTGTQPSVFPRKGPTVA